MREISSSELYTFNMILLLGVALSIVDLCAGSRRSLMDRQPLSTSGYEAVKNCSIPLQKNPDDVQISLFHRKESIPCNKTSCILEPGHRYLFQISFTTDRPVHNGTLIIDVYDRLTWRRPIYKKCLCRDRGVTCPLKAGQHAVFWTTLQMGVSKTNLYKVTPIRYSMRDTRDELIFCFIHTGRVPVLDWSW